MKVKIPLRNSERPHLLSPKGTQEECEAWLADIERQLVSLRLTDEEAAQAGSLPDTLRHGEHHVGVVHIPWEPAHTILAAVIPCDEVMREQEGCTICRNLPAFEIVEK